MKSTTSFFLKIRYGLILGVLAVLFAAFFFLLLRERYAVKSIVDEERRRYLASMVAEEFRIKSRDLTRYARSYCATKNDVYYDRYVNILQWSRGEIFRPPQLGSSISSRFEGRKISHREILDAIGLNDKEKEAFLKAETLSNTLAEYEMQAMKSVRHGSVVPGPLSPLGGETVPEFVIRSLYGEAYHDGLDRIAESVDDFVRQYQYRADALFENYQNVFSLGLFLQFLVQISLVASVVALILCLVAQVRRQHVESRRLMLDAMPIGCMIRDSEYNMIACNQELLKMLGLKDLKDAAEHFGERSPKLQPNGMASEAYDRQVQAEALKNGSSHFRWIHLNGKGQEFPAEVALIRVRQGNRDVTVAYIRDVSKEEAAAQEVLNSGALVLAHQEAENRMRQMLNTIPVGIAFFDDHFRLEDCNDVEMKLFGVGTKEEFLSRFHDLSPWYQPNGKVSKELMHEKFAAAEKQGVQSFEWIHQRPDGTIFPSEVTITRVRSGDRNIMVTCNRDLTEEKKMQARVAQANERIRLLFDATPLCCTLLDEEFKALDCNWEAVKFLGMSSKDDFLSSFEKVFPEYQPDGLTSLDFFRRKVKEAFQKGRVTFEGVAQDIRGVEIPIEVVFIPLLSNDTPTIAGYARDLRERKQLEKTETLAEIKMRFFANMSHEIRTPMNAIVGMSELLMEKKLDENSRRYVADIKSSADTLLSLINDLLDFSKLEEGKMQLVPRHYNFNELIDHAASTLGFAAKNKGLDFILEKKGELPKFLFGDNIRLKQILWNLIGNAIKFTETGSVKLAIADHGDQLRFDIIDTGIGIRENDIPHLFEAFMQVDQQHTAHIKGTGLGLGISKSIVEQMGGEIGVSSRYGKGTTFSFSIPKVIGDASQIEEHALIREWIVESSANILVVDDNEINLNVAMGIFGSLGFNIDTATSGKEAIHMVEQTDYDMVFMDHMMPEMDGVETTRRIRSLGEKYDRLPIIALTANAVHGAREMLIGSGMDGFVSKPIDRGELNRVLIEFLPKESYRVDKVRESGDSTGPDEATNELRTLLIDGVPDLNVALGMIRSGGDWNTFITSVKMLSRKLSDHVDRLVQLLTEEKISEYAIEVHGMKGVLAGLGCDTLSADAAELERAAKSGDVLFCRDNTMAFTEKLENLDRDLHDVFNRAKSSVQDGKTPGKVEELADVLTKIKFFLDDYDTDFAAALVKKAKEYRFDGSIEEKLARLEELIEEFDYDGAKELLLELGVLLENGAV